MQRVGRWRGLHFQISWMKEMKPQFATHNGCPTLSKCDHFTKSQRDFGHGVEKDLRIRPRINVVASDGEIFLLFAISSTSPSGCASLSLSPHVPNGPDQSGYD